MYQNSIRLSSLIQVIDDTFKQTLNLLIEHLEEEEFKIIHQTSIRLTSPIHLFSTRQYSTGQCFDSQV